MLDALRLRVMNTSHAQYLHMCACFPVICLMFFSREHLGKGMGQVPTKTPILTRDIGMGRHSYIPAAKFEARFRDQIYAYDPC